MHRTPDLAQSAAPKPATGQTSLDDLDMRPTRPLNRRWPNNQVFVAENVRLLYLPIAKNACSSLKRLVVELSDIPEREAVLKTSIHQITDSTNTGIQLKDKTAERAAEILGDEGYFRFVVLREPFDRLVSAYVDKFVQHRTEAPYILDTGAVVSAVQGVAGAAEADHTAGITFRQFAEHITAQPPRSLNAHWCPQIEYIEGVDYPHAYTLGDMDLLERDLTTHLGRPVALHHRNRSRGGERERVPGAADMVPAALEPVANRIASESFYEDDGLRALVAAYFARDLTFYRAVRDANAARRAAQDGAEDATPDGTRAQAQAPLPAQAPASTPLHPTLQWPAPRPSPADAPPPAPGETRPLRKRLSLNGLRRSLGRGPVSRPGVWTPPPPPEAARSAPAGLFVFLHIPKTAGTAVVHGLRAAFPQDAVYPHYGERFLRAEDPAEIRARYRFIAAHIGYRVAARFGDSIVTVLRDPVTRILSLYNYWRSLPEGAGRRRGQAGPIPEDAEIDPAVVLAKSLDFDAFLQSDDPRLLADLDNAQAWMLAASNVPIAREDHAGLSEEALYELAARNLASLDVIGVTEDLGPFFADLDLRFGIKGEAAPRNVTQSRTVERDGLSQAARDRLEALTRVDRRLYDAVRTGEIEPDPAAAAARRARLVKAASSAKG